MPDIELKIIQPNRLNPRLEFRKQALDELADSIRHVGLLEPIVVRPKDNGYEVVVGERRYRAAHQAGLDKVPVIIREYTDEEVLEVNLVENIQREDLSAVEKARVCQHLRDRYPAKYPDWRTVAARLGIPENTVYDWVRTLQLPEEIQSLVAPSERKTMPPGKIDYRTALEIARRVKNPERQVEVATVFAQQPMSRHIGTEVLKEAAREPDRPIREVVERVVKEAPIYLPFSKVHADAIVRRVKTQTSRKSKDPRLLKGSVVRAQVTHFANLEVVDVRRKKLGDFDEDDARREGGYTLAEFKEVWKQLHGQWNPDETVYVLQFRLLNVVGGED